MRRVKMPHVKTVTARGKAYLYFDTGGKKDGKPIMVRLPDPSSRQFGEAYSQAVAARNRRQEVVGVLTLPEFVRRYEKSPRFMKLSAGSQRVYSLYLAKLATAFNLYPADALTRQEVTELADSLAATPQAANMVVRITSALYLWGRQRGLVTARPADDIELFAGGEHQPWPEELLNAALAADDERIRLAVALLYYTAQRIGDVSKLRWNDIRGGTLYLSQQKTGKYLEIPVHRELSDILAGVARNSVHILAQPDGKPYSAQTTRRAIQAYAKSLGFKVVPHGLRKNAVNSLLQAGCSVAETAAISGQSLALVEHYAKRRSQPSLGSAAILKWEANRK